MVLQQKASRPKSIEGITVKVPTGCGNMYITLNSVDDKLFEVFGVLRKSGGCTKRQTEALTRCISLGLRYGIPIDEFVNQLQNICCHIPIWNEGKTIKSCPDAIAQILQSVIKGGK